MHSAQAVPCLLELLGCPSRVNPCTACVAPAGAGRKRHSLGGAFVLGDEVLVGAIALQDLDLIVAPALETVTVHPESPHIARGFAYGLRSRPHLKAPLGPVLSGT